MSSCRRRRRGAGKAKVTAVTVSLAQQKTDMEMTLYIRWPSGGTAAKLPRRQLDVTLNRGKLTVAGVSKHSPLREFLFEGDQLLAVNNKEVKTTDDIRQRLATIGRWTKLAIRAARQSWTEHDPQDRLLVTAMTTLQAGEDEEEQDGGCSRLGMMLKDVGRLGVVVVALEKLQRRRLVRPIHVNDIVCRVNQQPVVSASQAKQLIKDSLLRLDSVRLLLARPIEERRSAEVKAAVAQSYDVTKEPADDVKDCCAEQLGRLERAPPAQPTPLSAARQVLLCRSMLQADGEKDDPNFEQDNGALVEEPLSEFDATRTKKLNFAKFRTTPPVRMSVCAGWQLIGRLLSEPEAPRRRVHFPDCVRQRRDYQIGSDFEPNKQFRKTPPRGQFKTMRRFLRQKQLQQRQDEQQEREQQLQQQQQEEVQKQQQDLQQEQEQQQQQEQQTSSSSSNTRSEGNNDNV